MKDTNNNEITEEEFMKDIGRGVEMFNTVSKSKCCNEMLSWNGHCCDCGKYYKELDNSPSAKNTMNEYIQEDKIEDLLTKELDVLENAISDDNNALAICSREEIWKLVCRLSERSYNLGVEDSLRQIPADRLTRELKTVGWNDCRQQTIDNISKLLNNN